MSNKRFSVVLILIVLILTVSKIGSLTIKDIEENSYLDVYYVGSDGSRYYFWSGPPGGPHIKVDYNIPNIEDIMGYYISRFSSSGKWKYTSRVPGKGILIGAEYKIMEDEEGLVYLMNYSFEGYGLTYSYGFDSLGNFVWKSNASLPIYTEPAGIFQKDDGTRLCFGFASGNFSLFHFDPTGRKDKVILNTLDFFNRYNKLSLPYTKNWRVARIGDDRFLVVAFKSSVDRDHIRNMMTIGDYIHIISFLVNSKGEILGSVSLDNAEGKAATIEISRSSIKTAYYFRNFVDYFRMPDSSLFFVYAPFPEREKGDFVEQFLLYITKFTKDGELVSLTHKPKVLPLNSLPSGFRIKGFSFNREFWDYGLDSLGNFYIDVRKH